MQKSGIAENTCSAQQSTELFILNQGKIMYKQKKYKNALQYFQKATEINKNSFQAYQYLEQIIKALNKQEQFILKYSESIKIQPFQSVPYIKRGCLYYSLKNYQGALKDYDNAILLDAKNSVAYNLRAIVKSQLNLYQSALMDYQKSISLNPKYQETYIDRALLYQKKQKWESAINDYSRVIKINPKNYTAFNNRGLIYYEKKELEKAICDFNKAIELNPFFHTSYYNRAIIYQSQQQYGKSLKDYNKVIELKPDYWKAYNKRAFVYQRNNQLQKAIDDMNKVMQLHQQYGHHYNIGEWYFKLGNYELAQFHLTKYMQSQVKYNTCYYYMGRIELSKRNLQLSLEYLQKSISLAQWHKPQYFLYKGIVLDLLQENDKANEDYGTIFQWRTEGQKSLKQIYKEIHKFSMM